MGSEDVIHSYYIPAFRVKADVIPGRYNSLWFTATKPGRYHLFCAEYCGTKHSGMIGWITAMEPADYQAWLAGGPATASPVAAGEKLFQDLACSTCHQRGRRLAGRSSRGSSARRSSCRAAARPSSTKSYLRESIVNPQAKIVAGFQPIMPTFQGLVTEEQLLQLIAYVRSLGQQAAAGHDAAGIVGRIQESYGNRELPQRRPWHQVLAVDERPQAHRAPLPRVDHRLLRDGRVLRDVRPPGAADAGRRPAVERDLQQDVHHARRGDGLLLPDPVDSRGAGELPDPDHDRREGPGVPAHQPDQLVHLHPRRPVHDDRRRSAGASTPGGPSTRRTARRRRTPT